MDKLQINVNNCRDADAFHPAGKRKKRLRFCCLVKQFWIYNRWLISAIFLWLAIHFSLLCAVLNQICHPATSLIYDINVWYMFTIYCYYNCFHLINISLKEQQLIIKLTSNISSCHNEIYVSKCPSSAYFNDC